MGEAQRPVILAGRGLMLGGGAPAPRWPCEKILLKGAAFIPKVGSAFRAAPAIIVPKLKALRQRLSARRGTNHVYPLLRSRRPRCTWTTVPGDGPTPSSHSLSDNTLSCLPAPPF